jgi:hypothetical protein
MNMIRKMLKVGIIPGWMRITVDTGLRLSPVPTDSMTIAVGRLDILRGVATLVDQRMIGTR